MKRASAMQRWIIGFLFIASFSTHVFAQDGLNKRPGVAINSNCHGYLEYLPVGYTANTSQKYPLIIYVTGIGNTGDGSESQLENLFSGGGYPHEQQRAGNWVDEYTVNGQSFRFVIITPQFIQPMNEHIPSPSEINDIIDYSIQHYRVDTSRIYLMGSSQGGGAVWDYAGGSSQYAKRLAAIMPFAGVSFPSQEKANIMKYGKVAVWAFHNDKDDLVPPSFTNDYVNYYNNPPIVWYTAKKTMFDATGHLCWYLPLTRQYTEGGLNVYQWLLQYHTDPTTANAGDDQEIVLPANSAQLNGSGTAPDGTAASYFWEKFYGPAGGGTISNANKANPTVSGLVQGTYIFKLTITGNNSSTTSDYVAVVVNPTQQRIEDNQYSAYSGAVVDVTTSELSNGNATKIDGIDYNDWVEYSITVPVAGLYRLRFRVGTFYGGTRFKVQSSTGDLATVEMFPSGGWDNFMNLYANVFLQAGTQTIRLQNFPKTGLEGNVWYLNWFEIINTATAGAPLPVAFSLFNASCASGHVDLVWKTNGESNLAEYSVEKSNDGRSWNAIATIRGRGQSNNENSYSYQDIADGTNSFYRIAQKEASGKKIYSAVIRSNCNGNQNISLFPNPVVNTATLSISSMGNTRLNLSIVDAKGSVVHLQQTNLPKGNSQVSVDMSRLPAGSYTMLAQWGDENKTIKVLKK